MSFQALPVLKRYAETPPAARRLPTPRTAAVVASLSVPVQDVILGQAATKQIAAATGVSKDTVNEDKKVIQAMSDGAPVAGPVPSAATSPKGDGAPVALSPEEKKEKAQAMLKEVRLPVQRWKPLRT